MGFGGYYNLKFSREQGNASGVVPPSHCTAHGCKICKQAKYWRCAMLSLHRGDARLIITLMIWGLGLGFELLSCISL